MNGVVLAVCISDKKGTVKDEVESIRLRADYGVEGDAHAGGKDRQVSLLAEEMIDIMRAKGLALKPGAFGENIVTKNLDLDAVPVGSTLKIGGDVELLITKHGKECHTRCAIYYKTGDCIMPVHGVFANVVKGGSVKKGDLVEMMK